MAKPLLTDELIEQAKRGEIDLDETAHYSEDTEDVYDDYDVAVNGSDYKSRRLENARRSQFQRKLNRILFWVILLLILLFIAVFHL